jgi:bifunctional UDP-N-acetylglucosamine pyrophosphorylase/glucosamine-1-phosphate N-acetyltransferase
MAKQAREREAEQGFSVLVLAAGKATRFKSEHSKVLHPLAGKPLGEYVLASALAAGPERAYVVIGHEAEEVRQAFAGLGAPPGLTFIEQKEQLGTGHALLIARPELEDCPSPTLVVLVGDAPLLSAQTLRALVDAHHKARAAATVLTTYLDDPRGYGRVLRPTPTGPQPRAGRVRAIVEEKVCTPAQTRIREVNSGILCFARVQLLDRLDELSNENAQKEYLLTDLVQILNRHRQKVMAFPVADSRQVLGVNDRVELAQVEGILRRRKAETLMRGGVTVLNPEATYIDDGVEVGSDTTIEPGVSLLGSTRVGRACTLRAYSTIVDSVLGDRVAVRHYSLVTSCAVASDAVIGPFAHLRDGAVIEQEARIGNFVEVKKSRVGRGTKALHLTYLGDATLGEGVNVGAGTVTCNYDGEKKHPTAIEAGVFVGSGSMLVAPVRIGRNSYVAAGSTITEDVPPDSLALGRARQTNKEGWVRERPPARQEASRRSSVPTPEQAPAELRLLTGESAGGSRDADIAVRLAGEVTVIELKAQLTRTRVAKELGQKIRQAIGSDRKQVVVNLGHVTLIDSAAMGELVGAASALQKDGGQLKLSDVSPEALHTLQAANLHQFFEIHRHEADALASFGKGGRSAE